MEQLPYSTLVPGEVAHYQFRSSIYSTFDRRGNCVNLYFVSLFSLVDAEWLSHSHGCHLQTSVCNTNYSLSVLTNRWKDLLILWEKPTHRLPRLYIWSQLQFCAGTFFCPPLLYVNNLYAYFVHNCHYVICRNTLFVLLFFISYLHNNFSYYLLFVMLYNTNKMTFLQVWVINIFTIGKHQANIAGVDIAFDFICLLPRVGM